MSNYLDKYISSISRISNTERVDSPEVKQFISPKIELKKINNRSNDLTSEFTAPAAKKDYLKFKSKNF